MIDAWQGRGRFQWLLAPMLIVAAGSACSAAPERQADDAEQVDDDTRAVAPGHCRHHLPAAVCTRCTPALAAVFQAKGNWCAEHGFPETFCPVCHPDAELPEVGPSPPAAADWCGGHGVPESKCTQCHPDLIAGFKASGDWCETHGYPESVCPVCNPQPAPAQVADWCVEHGLPESQCTQCNPGLVAQYKAAGDWCAEHGFPESVCPVCRPVKAPAGAEQAAIETRTVRLRSAALEAHAGIETEPALRGPVAATLGCTVTIAFDADEMAEVRALMPGVVRRVHVALGSEVKPGDPLMELESTEVSRAQGRLEIAREAIRAAQANLERQRRLLADQIASQRQVEAAQRELATARAQARTESATLRMAGARQATGRFTLRAPIAGTVVRRPALLGTLARASASLATIANTSVMWALCDVPEARAASLAIGQRAEVRPSGPSPAPLPGKLTWISAEVEPRTRTVAARIELANPEGRLRAQQFASAVIHTGSASSAVLVPAQAIQRMGDHHLVFVRTQAGLYEPRVVQRHSDGERVAVTGRVRPGDQIVTTGAVLLRTEITPGSIGAGCCEVELPGAD